MSNTETKQNLSDLRHEAALEDALGSLEALNDIIRSQFTQSDPDQVRELREEWDRRQNRVLSLLNQERHPPDSES